MTEFRGEWLAVYQIAEIAGIGINKPRTGEVALLPEFTMFEEFYG